MWRVTDEGVWYWFEYPEADEYVMMITNTSSAWTTINSWTDSEKYISYDFEGNLHSFKPKPRCMFDEK